MPFHSDCGIRRRSRLVMITASMRSKAIVPSPTHSVLYVVWNGMTTSSQPIGT